MMEEIYTEHMLIFLSRVTKTAVACSSVCKSNSLCGKDVSQILRHRQRASDNQYEHSYMYIIIFTRCYRLV